jgi:hypothetical protein
MYKRKITKYATTVRNGRSEFPGEIHSIEWSLTKEDIEKPWKLTFDIASHDRKPRNGQTYNKRYFLVMPLVVNQNIKLTEKSKAKRVIK